MHSGSSLIPNNPAFSVSIGIAALVIEGRPLFEDEFVSDEATTATTNTITTTPAAVVVEQMRQNDWVMPFEQSSSSAFSRSTAASQRQQSQFIASPSSSPRSAAPATPSTASQHRLRTLAAYESKPDERFFNAHSTPSTFMSKQDTAQHLQRLRQKLIQLRATPGTSRDMGADQSVGVSVESSPTNAHAYDSDEELEMIFIQQKMVAEMSTSLNVIKPTALNSLQLLAANTLHRTPRSFNEHSGLLQAVESWSTHQFKPRFVTPTTAAATTSKGSTPSSAGSSTSSAGSSFSSATLTPPMLTNLQIAKLKAKAKFNAKSRDKKVLGPHCELFLQKIGLMKNNKVLADYSIDTHAHFCVRSNETCFRWQLHCRQLAEVFATGEPICIEVYLGPENNAILLEQWIIRKCDESTRAAMSLQALCSAIRSQLHFSQITAWSDSLKTCSPFDSEIKTNPRIKNTSLVSFKPKLDILYRIRSFDSTSCFSSEPIIHDFPDTMVTDQLTIQVSLKSLPRMKSIPRLHDFSKVPSNLTADDELNVQPMVVECNEKGKHRCQFDEESPTGDEIAPSHRDRQLQKYKKRMLRRDKKRRDDEMTPMKVDLIVDVTKDTGSIVAVTHKPYDQTINPNRPPLYSTCVPNAQTAKTLAACVASVSLGANHCSATKATQTSVIEMVSVSTQTDADTSAISFPSCDFCGIEMQYFCWNCDKAMFNESSMDDLSATSPPSTANQSQIKKSDRLLRAIQRTPSTKQNKAIDASMCCKRQKTVHNYFNRNTSSDDLDTKYCGNSSTQCYENTADDIVLSRSNDLMMNDASSSGGYRRTMSESVVGACHDSSNDIDHSLSGIHHMGIDLTFGGESMNILSDNELKLYRRAYSEDELICNCDDNRPKQLGLSSTSNHTSGYAKSPSPSNSELPLSTTTTTINNNNIVSPSHSDQFKTPTASTSTASQNQSHRKVNPLFIKCHNHDDEHTSDATPPTDVIVKALPKINLTKLFGADGDENDGAFGNCHANRDFDVNGELQKITQPIANSTTTIINATDFSLNNIFDFENLSPPLPSPTAGIHVVQKSNSAPTFHSPPTLSPRFLKSAAASKRRSRHLSDRSSERLSFGSDDHLSDEEFHQYCADTQSEYRPGISPTKATLRFFPKNYAFRKRALLGSFEESLLQRRLEPKFLVPGYKVLLAASGCYCTNQITIPAYTFFYELNAETLSTPYVCEVSMPPRKGYVIPRTGQVQATLLNPNGMVVRMFVVAYDFRDMPAMSQTFVRQRILSFDENANPGQSVDDLTASEQQKLLRYAIHLRFQTTRSGRLALHSDIRMLISRRTDCDTAAAHAKGALESPSELKTVTIVPENPRFSPR